MGHLARKGFSFFSFFKYLEMFDLYNHKCIHSFYNAKINEVDFIVKNMTTLRLLLDG